MFLKQNFSLKENQTILLDDQFFQSVDSENDLVESTKFLLFQPSEMFIIWITKYLGNPTKSFSQFYEIDRINNLVDSTKHSVESENFWFNQQTFCSPN